MDETICYCAGVSRQTVIEAIRAGAASLHEVQRATGAGIGSRCRELNPKGVCCHSDILAILQAERGHGQ